MPTTRKIIDHRAYALLCNAEDTALIQFNDVRSGGIRVHVGPSAPDKDTLDYIKITDLTSPLPFTGAADDKVYARGERQETYVMVVSST